MLIHIIKIFYQNIKNLYWLIITSFRIPIRINIIATEWSLLWLVDIALCLCVAKFIVQNILVFKPIKTRIGMKTNPRLLAEGKKRLISLISIIAVKYFALIWWLRIIEDITYPWVQNRMSSRHLVSVQLVVLLGTHKQL